jgi:hypothetical protein
MPHPDPRTSDLATVARPPRHALFLDLGDLLAQLLLAISETYGSGFRAGYALRCRQEANRQRLACPACRAAMRGRQGP